MSTTLTLEPASVRPGDTVVAIDGRDLAHRLTVATPPAVDTLTIALSMHRPAGSAVDWSYYLEPGQTVTVERAELRPAPTPAPAAAPPKKRREDTWPRMYTMHGVRLVKDGPREHYRTPDGRYHVMCDPEHITECEKPHPIRYARNEWTYGRKGGYCPGGVEHTYTMWGLWEGGPISGDWVERCETMREVLDALPPEYRTH